MRLLSASTSSRTRVLARSVSLAILVTASPCLATDGSSQTSSHLFSDQVVAVTEAILQHHIDPPTRQEMLLSGMRAVYLYSGRDQPIGLSQQISDLADRQQLADWLESVERDFKDFSPLQRVMVNGMFEVVPGGGGLVDREEAGIQEQLAANRYVGVGIALAKDKQDVVLISQVIYDGPAWHAGLKDQDRILEIDGVSTQGEKLQETVQRLRGEAGSQLTVVVQQPDESPREIQLTRGVTFIPTVEGFRQIKKGHWQYHLDEQKDIGFVRITRIGPSTVHELRKIEASLRNHPLTGVILDLRDGGGILHDTVMVADQFLEAGTIGHVRSVENTTSFEAHPGSLFRNLPLVVLIAKYTNADRVFLTAALQDRERAIVVGQSNGPGTYVHSHVALPSGDRLRMATGVMLRGDGTPLLRRRPPRQPVVRTETELGSPIPEERSKPSVVVPDQVVDSISPGRAELEQADSKLLRHAIRALRSGEKTATTPADSSQLPG